MNTVDLLNAIGEADDILIKNAKMNQKTHRLPRAVLGSAAACFILCLTVSIVFFTMKGANSSFLERSPSNPHDTSVINMENAHPKYEYKRVSIMSPYEQMTITDEASMIEIHQAISAIEENAYTKGTETEQNGDPYHSTDSDASHQSSRIESSPLESMTTKKQYVIELFRHDGDVLRYKLTESVLTDLSSGKKYSLTEEEAEKLMNLIEKGERE